MDTSIEKNTTSRIVNYVVVFILLGFVIGAVFAYIYLKNEGYFASTTVGEPIEDPLTEEEKIKTLGSLESAGSVDVSVMNGVLRNMSQSDVEVSQENIKQALDSLE